MARKAQVVKILCLGHGSDPGDDPGLTQVKEISWVEAGLFWLGLRLTWRRPGSCFWGWGGLALKEETSSHIWYESNVLG